MPEPLLDALRRLAVLKGYESPDTILARHACPRAWRRPIKWWLI